MSRKKLFLFNRIFKYRIFVALKRNGSFQAQRHIILVLWPATEPINASFGAKQRVNNNERKIIVIHLTVDRQIWKFAKKK